MDKSLRSAWRSIRKIRYAALAAAGAAGLLNVRGAKAQDTTYTWTAAPTAGYSSSWSAPATNWLGSNTPTVGGGSNLSIIFAPTTSNSFTATLDAGIVSGSGIFELNNMTFNAGSVTGTQTATIGASGTNTLQFEANASNNASINFNQKATGAITINPAIFLNDSTNTIFTLSGTATSAVIFGGTITGTDNIMASQKGATTFSASNALSSTGNVTFSNGAAVTFSNTSSGQTQINNVGNLSFYNSGSVALNGGPLTSLTSIGSSVDNVLFQNGNNAISIGGVVANNGTLTDNSGATTFSGSNALASTGNVTFSNTGAVTFSNTSSSQTQINTGGTLSFYNSGSVGLNAGALSTSLTSIGSSVTTVLFANSNTVTIGGTVNNNGSFTANHTAGAFTFSAANALASTGPVSFSNNGAVTFSNTSAGQTQINTGSSLSFYNSGAVTMTQNGTSNALTSIGSNVTNVLFANAGNVAVSGAIANSGTLDFNNTGTITYTNTAGIPSSITTLTINNTSTGTISGPIANNGNIVIDSGTTTFANTISSSGGLLVNAGQINLTNTNTGALGWGGTTQLLGGNLTITKNTTTGYISNSSTNAFYWSGGIIGTGNAVIANPSFLSGTIGQGDDTTANLSGPITLNGATTLQAYGTGSTSSLILSGQIQSTTNTLTITTAASDSSAVNHTEYLEGSANNLNTGLVSVLAGKLDLAMTGNYQAFGGNLTIGDNGQFVNGFTGAGNIPPTVIFGNANSQIPLTSIVTVEGPGSGTNILPGVINLNGHAQTIGYLQGGGWVGLSANTFDGGTIWFTLAPGSADTFSGNIAEFIPNGVTNIATSPTLTYYSAYNSLGVIVSGTGPQTFSGNNTYIGGTLVNTGATLRLGSSQALGATLNGLGTLGATGTAAILSNYLISSGGAAAPSNEVVTGSNTVNGTLDLNGQNVSIAEPIILNSATLTNNGSSASTLSNGFLGTTFYNSSSNFSSSATASYSGGAGGGTAQVQIYEGLSSSSINLNITNGGAGYTTAPAVTLASGSPLYSSLGGIVGPFEQATFRSIINTNTGSVTGISVTFPGNYTPAQMAAALSGVNTLNFSGGGAGVTSTATASFTLTGDGTFVLSGIQTAFTGGTYTSAPTLTISDPTGATANLNTQLESVVLNGANTISGVSDINIPVPVSGTGGFTKSGTNNLVLSGPNSYAGGTIINQGAVKLGSGTALGFGGINPIGQANASTTVSNGASLDLGGQNITQPIILNGATLTNSAAGRAILNNNVLGSSITAQSGTFSSLDSFNQSYTGGSGSGAAANIYLGFTANSLNLTSLYGTSLGSANANATLTLDILSGLPGTSVGSIAVPAVITVTTDANSMISGSSVVTVVNPGAYTPAQMAIIVANGTNAAYFPTSTSPINPVFVDNNFALSGIQQINAGAGYTSTPTLNISDSNGATATLNTALSSLALVGSNTINGTGDIEIDAAISGSGTFNQAGANNLYLTNPLNSLPGGFTISSGAVIAQAASGYGSVLGSGSGAGAINFSGGTLTINDDGAFGGATNTTLSYGNNVNVTAGSGTLNVNPVTTSTGNTVALGALDVENSNTLTVNGTAGYTASFASTLSNTQGTIVNNTAATLNLGNLDVESAATLTLASGTNGFGAQAASTLSNSSGSIVNNTVATLNLGSLTLNSATLTLSSGSNGYGVLFAGTHSAPAGTIVNNTTLTFDGTGSIGTITGSGNLDIGDGMGGTASISVSTLDPNNLTINSGSLLQLVHRSPAAAAQVDSLAINNGTLDLVNNGLVVNYGTSGTVLPSIVSLVLSAKNGGAWNGTGITSSLIPSNSGLSIGAGEASAVPSLTNAGAIFMGQTLSSTNAVVARVTYAGDANLDGVVNAADLIIWKENFGVNTQAWTSANFNYTGKVNASDLVLWKENFGKRASSLAVVNNVLPATPGSSASAAAGSGSIGPDLSQLIYTVNTTTGDVQLTINNVDLYVYELDSNNSLIQANNFLHPLTPDGFSYEVGPSGPNGTDQVTEFSNGSGSLLNGTFDLGDLYKIGSGTSDLSSVYNYDASDNEITASFVYVSAPEPSSLSLIGLGAMGLLARRRRRKTADKA